MTEAIGAIATIIAVIGVVLNNRMNRACFVLWIFSNLISAALHAVAGMNSLCCRDLIFFVLAIEGFYKWKFKQGLNA